ncbi:MAG TPA: winged helix-turn-helix domain-containing protein, partial [Fusibacter sp.]|nr:winged helix-turn-helix domain-containing protein [Fusibacter sp.]
MIAAQMDADNSKLIIQTLGRFDVIKEGSSLVMSSSGSKKLWELFKFMLTHRDRSFTPETLMDQLWVSETYSDPRSTLRRQMHRLRQSLAEEDAGDQLNTIRFTNGYYKWNETLDFEIDIDLFERLIKQGDAYMVTAPQKALDYYLEALSYY